MFLWEKVGKLVHGVVKKVFPAGKGAGSKIRFFTILFLENLGREYARLHIRLLEADKNC